MEKQGYNNCPKTKKTVLYREAFFAAFAILLQEWGF